jgi:hypothetical protein
MFLRSNSCFFLKNNAVTRQNQPLRFFTCSRDTVGDVHKHVVLVIHIIMGRGPSKGVKDSRRRTVNSTQKSKHNKGGNGGTAAANGERSTTALSKMSKESAVCCHAQHCIKKM